MRRALPCVIVGVVGGLGLLLGHGELTVGLGQGGGALAGLCFLLPA